MRLGRTRAMWCVALGAVVLVGLAVVAGGTSGFETAILRVASANTQERAKAARRPTWMKIGTSGKTLVILCPSVITAIGKTPPSLSINGAPAVALVNGAIGKGGPYTAGTVHGYPNWPARPYVIWPLTTPVKATDKVTLSAPEGWIVTQNGPAPACEKTAVENSVRLELVPYFDHGPQKMKLGINLASMAFWSPIQVYSNILKQAGEWGTGGNKVVRFKTDADGDVVTLAGGSVESIVSSASAAESEYPAIPSGVYTVEWEGGGKLELRDDGGETSRVRPTGEKPKSKDKRNRMTYRVEKNPKHAHLNLRLRANAAPVKNAAVYLPGTSAKNPTKFSPEFLRMTSGFHVIRAMDIVNTNNNNVVEFSDWARPSARSYVAASTQRGPHAIESVTNYDNKANGAYFWENGRAYVLVTTKKPHGFTSGQIATFNDVKQIALSHDKKCSLWRAPIRVVSPTSFAIDTWVGSTETVQGTQSPGGWVTVKVSPGMPLEDLCELSNLQRADLYFDIPTLASDDCVRQTAEFLATKLDSGLKLYLEYSNEVWNASFGAFSYAHSQGRLQSPPIGHHDWYALRSARIHAIASEVFAAHQRSKDLVRVFASQFSWLGKGSPTDMILSAAQKNRYPVDALAIAPYIDVTDPLLPRTWDVGMCHDVFQIALQHDPAHSKQTLARAIAFHKSALASHGFSSAKLICYEGCPQIFSSSGTLSIYAGRDPRMYRTTLAYYQILANNGVDLFVHFDLAQGFLKNGANWPMYVAWNQKPGLGDGSDGLADNRLSQKYVDGAPKEDFRDRAWIVSPIAKAAMDWIALSPD